MVVMVAFSVMVVMVITAVTVVRPGGLAMAAMAVAGQLVCWLVTLVVMAVRAACSLAMAVTVAPAVTRRDWLRLPAGLVVPVAIRG